MRISATLAAGSLLAFLLAFPAAAHDSGEAHSGASQCHHDGATPHEAAASEPVEAGDLVISAYWTRATLPNQKVGGGYLTIENTGDEGDRLTGVASPVTDRAEMHEMSVEDDVMTMRRIDGGLAIPAGETVAFEPGGYHLMFQDLAEGFVEGGSVSVTLQFEKAGEVTLALPVLPAGTRDAGGAHRH